MAINNTLLVKALREAQAKYKSSPTAVRTGGVIAPLHRFCVAELVARNFPEASLHPKRRENKGPKRIRLLGGYMPKEIDVCLSIPDSGPLLAISGKSQMSSIIKKTSNRFEEYVGDATNLHSRFPMLVLGFLMLVPVNKETFGGGKPTDGLRRIAALLERSNARRVVTEPSGSYEVSSLLLVDFGSTPPRVMPEYPEKKSPLRIENFFDKLVDLYQQRNQFVKL